MHRVFMKARDDRAPRPPATTHPAWHHPLTGERRPEVVARHEESWHPSGARRGSAVTWLRPPRVAARRDHHREAPCSCVVGIPECDIKKNGTRVFVLGSVRCSRGTRVIILLFTWIWNVSLATSNGHYVLVRLLADPRFIAEPLAPSQLHSQPPRGGARRICRSL
jgi:hypothetical protein